MLTPIAPSLARELVVFVNFKVMHATSLGGGAGGDDAGEQRASQVSDCRNGGSFLAKPLRYRP
jgi:hypothetical protein